MPTFHICDQDQKNETEIAYFFNAEVKTLNQGVDYTLTCTCTYTLHCVPEVTDIRDALH